MIYSHNALEFLRHNVCYGFILILHLCIYRTVLKATVILLPLLGITWVFGLLAVNQESSVFAWIFTILNSLQVRYDDSYALLWSISLHKPINFIRT